MHDKERERIEKEMPKSEANPVPRPSEGDRETLVEYGKARDNIHSIQTLRVCIGKHMAICICIRAAGRPLAFCVCLRLICTLEEGWFAVCLPDYQDTPGSP